MSRAAINKDLIRWAVDRSGQDEAALVERFPKLPQWEAGEVQPTFKQLEDFAQATLTPFGAFFLPRRRWRKCPCQISAPCGINVRGVRARRCWRRFIRCSGGRSGCGNTCWKRGLTPARLYDHWQSLASR